MTRIVIILNVIKMILYMLLLIVFTILIIIAAFRQGSLYGFIALTGLGLLWMKHINIKDK